jgi:hypothetical protein
MKKEKKVSYQGKVYEVILDTKGSFFRKPSLKIFVDSFNWLCIFQEKSHNNARLSNMFENNQIIKDILECSHPGSLTKEKTVETIINLDEI